MAMLTSGNHWEKVSPIQSLIFVILITFVGFVFIGPFVGIIAALPFYDGGLLDMARDLSNPAGNGNVKSALYIAQAFSTFIGFIAIPYLYSHFILNVAGNQLVNKSIPTPVMSLIVAVAVVSFMGVNSIFIEWNANLDLPDSLSGFERWARNFEDSAQEITSFLTQFNSDYEFLIALVVIAILPALGEEFVFRGLIQNHLKVITKNIHLSIWIAAIFFSFFHMQFFGFLPRILLGALFGYLYAWSGNLAYPIIAHFANNAFTLLMIYLYNKGTVDFDNESAETIPIYTVIVSAGITAVLLYVFKSYFRKGETVYG